jgi:hypothetical protein
LKKWGQAPAKQRIFLGLTWDGRSQSPFFHKFSAPTAHHGYRTALTAD